MDAFLVVALGHLIAGGVDTAHGTRCAGFPAIGTPTGDIFEMHPILFQWFFIPILGEELFGCAR